MINADKIMEEVDCDYLVIGAGSSGCVVTSRLVRLGLKVVLIEGGPVNAYKHPHVRRPHLWIKAASSGTPISEPFLTVPQEHLNSRRIPAYRGLGAGGTSNVNASLYFRGRKDDYQGHWPWDLKDIQSSFEAVESELELEEYESPGYFGDTFATMMGQAGFTTEASGGRTSPWTEEGLQKKWMCTTTSGGERQTAWEGFINPLLAMPNLEIRDDTMATKILVEDGRAVGVELLQQRGRGRGCRITQLRLKRTGAEVILCGGVFRTPKLLMLSGIGPRQHLDEMKIPVLVESEQVGCNLQDHLLISTATLNKKTVTAEDCTEDGCHGHLHFSVPTSPPTAREPASPPPPPPPP
ncbi:unnamed protein product, partial [Choristocarpus tenellus]